MTHVVSYAQLLGHELGHVYNYTGHCQKSCFMDQAMSRLGCAAMADLGILQDRKDYARSAPNAADRAGTGSGFRSATCETTWEETMTYDNVARDVQAIACLISRPGEVGSEWSYCSTSLCADEWPTGVRLSDHCAKEALDRDDVSKVRTVDLPTGQTVCRCVEEDAVPGSPA